ncbi:hypothetical protein B6I21_03120 [candidate division KSB1 bacterium 4572_119]|nr:MAG: hypothetical protein B6I21_03120 [candidate division KSB1 bacterium 4572_119]
MNFIYKAIIVNLAIAAALFILVCEKNTGIQKVDDNKFVQIYCDIVTLSDIIKPEARKLLIDSVLTHYQVSKESYYATKKSYDENNEKWSRIYEKIVAELEKRAGELKESKEEKAENEEIKKETKSQDEGRLKIKDKNNEQP